MAIEQLLNGTTGYAVKVAIGAELVYQLTGANMSSPQTAELNAAARAPTIGKWVNLTVSESAGWIALLTAVDLVAERRFTTAWLLGGGIAMFGMWAKYKYGIKAGLESGEPGTEDYGSPWAA